MKDPGIIRSDALGFGGGRETAVPAFDDGRISSQERNACGEGPCLGLVSSQQVHEALPGGDLVVLDQLEGCIEGAPGAHFAVLVPVRVRAHEIEMGALDGCCHFGAFLAHLELHQVADVTEVGESEGIQGTGCVVTGFDAAVVKVFNHGDLAVEECLYDRREFIRERGVPGRDEG